MQYKELQEQVFEANIVLGASGLVVMTWGNVSGISEDRAVMAIKPSGMSYEEMRPEHMVLVDTATGKVLEGDLNPSSDTETHLILYRDFPGIGGITHTHSPYAVGWAQAGKPIPALGTTHADTFYGPVPVTRPLNKQEVEEAYELNTGVVISDHFKVQGIDALAVPAVLVASHGPFTWGKTPMKSVENSVVLEEVAKMALFTDSITKNPAPVPDYLLDKHYFRKHGSGAYYGQGNE